MRHSWATLSLWPLLLWQGHRVRRTMPNLPEPPGERSGELGEGPALRLLIVGDSSAAGVGASSQAEALSGQLTGALAAHRRVRWKLLANTGFTTAQTARMLAEQAPEPFDVVVASLGVNDVTEGLRAGTWLRHQAALIALLRERFAAARIVLCGLPPVHVFPGLPQPLRWYLGERTRHYNRVLQRWAARRGDIDVVTVVYDESDPLLMASDGFHAGPRAYAVCGRVLAEHLRGAPAVIGTAARPMPR